MMDMATLDPAFYELLLCVAGLDVPAWLVALIGGVHALVVRRNRQRRKDILAP